MQAGSFSGYLDVTSFHMLIKKKESSCKLLNMSFLVLKIQLSLLQCMARDEALTARSSRNYPQMK